MPHETLCGDVWRIAERPGELSIMIADGLEICPLAADAAEEGAMRLRGQPVRFAHGNSAVFGPPHAADWGAAMATARFAAASGLVKYAGVETSPAICAA